MTVKQRVIAIGIVCGLLLSGFAFGRLTDSPPKTSAEENKMAVTALTSAVPVQTPNPASNLQDFKAGYDNGFNSALTGAVPAVAAGDVANYNEGFKQGYADASKSRLTANNNPAPVVYRTGQQVVYRSPAPVAKRKSNSKLKTVLTIAAPAAIGAGIGAAAGGGKGAGIGALIGGGGGAMYHLIKNRNR